MSINFEKITTEKRLKIDESGKNIVEIRNLDIFFGKGALKNHAIKDVSFNVNKGEILGLVGESGSGKTTIGRAIVGLINSAKGTIKIDDINIPNKASKVKRSIRNKLVKSVQMIFQDPASSLNPYKTITKIVKEGLDNINVKELFQKHFNEETIFNLNKMISKAKQPSILKKYEISYFSEMAIQDPSKLENIIYKTIYDEFKDDNYIRTYIELRRDSKTNLINEFHSDDKIKEKLIKDVVESVGLSAAMLARYPLEFSGGQQQRVGIARSIVMQPRLIIADEPISALDVSIQAQVINIFNELKDKLNLTFLFIAHDLRMVDYISDRIAVIYKGRIIEIGSANEVVNDSIHPYTRSLVSSIPTINTINESLRSIPYDWSIHGYNETKKPKWFKYKKAKGEHYVLGTSEEVEKWIKEKKNAS